jgi:hypothetical protein
MKTLVSSLVLAALLASCAPNTESDTTGNNPVPANSSETIQVSGVVTEKDDKVPADGGVTLRIRSDAGDAITLEFESLFTLPRPTPERQDLYQKLVPIQAGDRVRATATRKDGMLRLESIEKVGG